MHQNRVHSRNKHTVVQKERRELTASVIPTAAGYNNNGSISSKISFIFSPLFINEIEHMDT